MARYVALLRGVNLGPRSGRADGRAAGALEELGYEDVRTLLQSGNVGVTTAKPAKAVREELEAAIADRFGVETVVVLRTPKELEALVGPSRSAMSPTSRSASRSGSSPARRRPRRSRSSQAADVEPEVIAVAGKEIHVWHAGGIQRSPASKVLERADLGVTGTARNWNTVEKLLDLA